MKIIFGLKLDDYRPVPGETSAAGVLRTGVHGLISYLEAQLGLGGHTGNMEYIRIEQYRQAMLKHWETAENPFYLSSFEADRFATSEELLSRRDELLMSGWDFQIAENMPERLKTLAEIEMILSEDMTLSWEYGFADRFKAVLEELTIKKHEISEIALVEPRELLPVFVQRLLDSLAVNATLTTFSVKELKTWNEDDHFPVDTMTDLQYFQKTVAGEAVETGYRMKNDGSILLVRARRETDAATFFARFFKQNPGFRPALLIETPNMTLDNALVKDGLPGMGLQSVSLARPALQLLKLITTFLWRPIDPTKILEFVTLALKPLDDDLAKVIARQIARKPGMKGEGWYGAIHGFFNEMEDAGKDTTEIRKEYDFWFERKRYDREKAVPVRDAIQIFRKVSKWARTLYQSELRYKSLLVLASQAQRIVDLLEALPERQLTNLELERIVRTIYEPAPIVFHDSKAGHLPVVTADGAVYRPVDDLLWWNFIQDDTVHFFSRWYLDEIQWLLGKGVMPDTPKKENEQALFHRNLPVLNSRQRIIFVIPGSVNGTESVAHPLLGDLLAIFGDLSACTYDIDDDTGAERFRAHFDLPKKVVLPRRHLPQAKSFLHFNGHTELTGKEYETYTSLDDLFFYPYQWFFKHKAKLKKSPLLSMVGDTTLMGNLAHRLFELFFNEKNQNWNRQEVYRWVERKSAELFIKEGATLLMYGREPERVAFTNRVKYAIWMLLSILRDNGWEVLATEMNLEGSFGGRPIKGIADLVLKRGEERAIVDLKWRGASRREKNIKNEEDLQLVLYSELLKEQAEKPVSLPHTAYFVIEEARMIARNNLAFKEAIAVVPEEDYRAVHERILRRMEATLRWRLAQLQSGLVEVRTARTSVELEEIYDEQGINLLEMLEMKGEDAYFDDFRVLIGEIK